MKHAVLLVTHRDTRNILLFPSCYHGLVTVVPSSFLVTSLEISNCSTWSTWGYATLPVSENNTVSSML